MPDLGDLIRAKLKEINEGAEYGNEQALGMLLDVAHAVMELHHSTGSPYLHCAECFLPDTTAQPWPCDTVEAVAKALGIQEG